MDTCRCGLSFQTPPTSHSITNQEIFTRESLDKRETEGLIESPLVLTPPTETKETLQLMPKINNDSMSEGVSNDTMNEGITSESMSEGLVVIQSVRDDTVQCLVSPHLDIKPFVVITNTNFNDINNTGMYIAYAYIYMYCIMYMCVGHYIHV